MRSVEDWNYYHDARVQAQLRGGSLWAKISRVGRGARGIEVSLRQLWREVDDIEGFCAVVGVPVPEFFRDDVRRSYAEVRALEGAWLDTLDLRPVILPMRYEVCGLCRGRGETVNPSIDANGLTAEDFEDLDFREDYCSGAYNIPCAECHGLRVVPVVDYDYRSSDGVEARLVRYVVEYEKERARSAREEARALAMGY